MALSIQRSLLSSSTPGVIYAAVKYCSKQTDYLFLRSRPKNPCLQSDATNARLSSCESVKSARWQPVTSTDAKRRIAISPVHTVDYSRRFRGLVASVDGAISAYEPGKAAALDLHFTATGCHLPICHMGSQTILTKLLGGVSGAKQFWMKHYYLLSIQSAWFCYFRTFRSCLPVSAQNPPV